MRGKPRGFTLVEVIVAVAICALIAGAASPALFQIMTGTERNNNRVTAVRQVQQAGTWISRDAIRARNLTVPVDDGFPLTLSWGELWPQEGEAGLTYVSTERSLTYTLLEDKLQRQESSVTVIYNAEGQQQGAPTTVNTTTLIAQYLSAAAASWGNGILTVTLTARFPMTSPRYAAEETRIYEIKPRPLQ